MFEAWTKAAQHSPRSPPTAIRILRILGIRPSFDVSRIWGITENSISDAWNLNFENSISYYSSDILKYSTIIQEVEQKLDSTKNLIQKKINAKRNRQDSLINISKSDTGDLKKNNYSSSPIYREKKFRKTVQKSQ